MPATSKRPPCIYCGKSFGKTRRGEHIVQEAIGGKKTLKMVCPDCNQGFSGIDRELCSRSFLAAIASQEFSERIWHCWDVHHRRDNVLLESKPNWRDLNLTMFPQLVFETSEISFYADAQQASPYGLYLFQFLIRAGMRAYQAERRKKRDRLIHREKTDLSNDPFFFKYRYPPRAYFPYDLPELARRVRANEDASCIIRYLHPSDFNTAMNGLSKLNTGMEFKPSTFSRGSPRPAFQFIFSVNDSLRALLKTAINLLACYCEETPVNRDTFPAVIQRIRGDVPIGSSEVRQNGFVWPEEIASISKPGCHSFRLVHDGGLWVVLFSYFGGRIGAAVRFRGPSNERWRMLDITAPIESSDWTAQSSNLVVPLKVHIEWQNGRKIIPSIQVQESISTLEATLVPDRRN